MVLYLNTIIYPFLSKRMERDGTHSINLILIYTVQVLVLVQMFLGTEQKQGVFWVNFLPLLFRSKGLENKNLSKQKYFLSFFDISYTIDIFLVCSEFYVVLDIVRMKSRYDVLCEFIIH